MQIAKNKVVAMNYVLKDENGQVIDSSEGREPLAYIQGTGQIIPGLEKEMEGKKVGDKIQAVIAPENAYGLYMPEMVQEVPLSGFQGEGNEQLQEGMQVRVETNNGPAIAMVSKIDGDTVTLDMNHPLADKTLHFDVEVMDVRDATEEELAHGHVHGAGGHQH